MPLQDIIDRQHTGVRHTPPGAPTIPPRVVAAAAGVDLVKETCLILDAEVGVDVADHMGLFTTDARDRGPPVLAVKNGEPAAGAFADLDHTEQRVVILAAHLGHAGFIEIALIGVVGEQGRDRQGGDVRGGRRQQCGHDCAPGTGGGMVTAPLSAAGSASSMRGIRSS